MQERNRSEGWKQLQNMRTLYLESKPVKSVALIPYSFIPELRSRTLSDAGFLPYALKLGYDQRLDCKVANNVCSSYLCQHLIATFLQLSTEKKMFY